MIRAVGVDFLNARPLWESLKDDPRVDLSLAIPSELARSLAEGEADVGLLPVAAAATMGDLRLLRNLAIGAALSFGSWYGFYVGLGLPIPAGILDGVL